MTLPLSQIGSDNPHQLMHRFHEIGSRTVQKLRNYSTSPNKVKQPRAFGSIIAAKLVGVSNPKFRKIVKEQLTHKGNQELSVEEQNKNGVIKITNENGRQVTKYTLECIWYLRQMMGNQYIRPKNTKTIVLAVSNFKGGVGKTETAVDLAKKCAIEGLRTLLVDLDAQATATLVGSGKVPDLELSYDQTITKTLTHDHELIHDVILNTYYHGLDIIPANLAIQDCELILPNKSLNNNEKLGSQFIRLNNALELVKDRYDVIVFDCGPNMGALTLNAIVAADSLLVPLPPNMNDYASFTMYSACLANIFKQLKNKALRFFRVVLSKHPSSNESLQLEAMMRQQFGHYVLNNHMCETVEVAKAANDIGTIYDRDKPRGSREAYIRALQHLDDVNLEIINLFKELWLNESNFNTDKGQSNEQSKEKCA